jgi:3-deoxy-D-manno-octulosonic-acid transferase/heptosyltransferase-1
MPAMQRLDLIGSITRIVPERRPPPVDGSRLRTVLIIKLSSVGDVVHALPVASALKRSYPELHITWAVEEWTAPVVAAHPCVDRLVVFPTLVRWPRTPLQWAKALARAVRELRSERYDVILDLQGLARSALMSAVARSRLRVARAGQREGAHLVSYGVPLPDGQLHAVDEYLQVAQHLGAHEGPATFALPVSDAARRSIARMLAGHGVGGDEPLIVVNPSAARRWKEWPLDRWTRVVEALAEDVTVVVVGTTSHQDRHAQIAARSSKRTIDMTGKTTLSELIALLDRATLHVAPDTGTVHLAAALGTPVVAVYGPTPPGRVGPYRHPEAVVHHGEECGATCPGYCFRARRCLAAATADELIAKARAALRGAASWRGAVL